MVKTNCLFPFTTNMSSLFASCLSSEAEILSGITCLCVCSCVCFPQHDTGQSVILAMRNESVGSEDWEAESLLVLSVWADDLGRLHISKQSALILGPWPNEVFLHWQPWWAGLELRHNFAFPPNDGSDCLPVHQNNTGAIWTSLLYLKYAIVGICSDCYAWVTSTQRQGSSPAPSIFRSI